MGVFEITQNDLYIRRRFSTVYGSNDISVILEIDVERESFDVSSTRGQRLAVRNITVSIVNKAKAIVELVEAAVDYAENYLQNL